MIISWKQERRWKSMMHHCKTYFFRESPMRSGLRLTATLYRSPSHGSILDLLWQNAVFFTACATTSASSWTSPKTTFFIPGLMSPFVTLSFLRRLFCPPPQSLRCESLAVREVLSFKSGMCVSITLSPCAPFPLVGKNFLSQFWWLRFWGERIGSRISDPTWQRLRNNRWAGKIWTWVW